MTSNSGQSDQITFHVLSMMNRFELVVLFLKFEVKSLNSADILWWRILLFKFFIVIIVDE